MADKFTSTCLADFAMVHRAISVDLDGTSDGAVKGWENRRGVGGDWEARSAGHAALKEQLSEKDSLLYNDLPVAQMGTVKQVVGEFVAKSGKPDSVALEESPKGNGAVRVLIGSGSITIKHTIGPKGGIDPYPNTPARSTEDIDRQMQRTARAIGAIREDSRSRKLNMDDVIAEVGKKVKALVLDGTSEGAIAGWENRRGVGSHDESSRRSHEGYGGSRTPGEGDRVTIKGNVGGAGKGGYVSSSAPSGSFHYVTDNKGNTLGSYHSSNLKVKNASADREDAAIALGVSKELAARAGKHRALVLDGTSEGAVKGWENRKGGGSDKPSAADVIDKANAEMAKLGGTLST